ncbi:MAG: hypothetical protein M3Y17_03690 [Actinomycetota bacterium]|nr:hypothetical protein [Actinomycetota bacterium]
MRLIITTGTLFTTSRKKQRYEEIARLTLEVSEERTIGELIQLVDRRLRPAHPGCSYLSLPAPHEALPDRATLGQLEVADGSTLRYFSRVR